MSIGVSYTGHDGRRAEFSVQDAQDAAARMSGLSGRSMQESMNDAQGLIAAVRKNGAARPAQQAQKPSREPGHARGKLLGASHAEVLPPPVVARIGHTDHETLPPAAPSE